MKFQISSRNRVKYFVLLAVVVMLLVFSFGYYEYFRKPIDVQSSNVQIHVNAKSLTQEYQADLSLANSKYLQKITSVSGAVTAIEEGESLIVLLDNNVRCELKHSDNSSIKIGDKVNIKGIVVGYDELFEEISLKRCVKI